MKVTDLTELVAASLNDVIPIVDVSEDITKKVQTVNLPISTATQTALDTKQDTLVSGTTIKTVNSTSLLGSGNVSVQETLVSGTNIKTINSTSLLGSGDVVVQETLVSGTNIKTINSTSLLGSGDISISANPSGGAGSIQFSDGTAFASDSNLFWDNTNKRLGVGTGSPQGVLQIKTTQSNTNGSIIFQNNNGNLITSSNDAVSTLTQLTIRASNFQFVAQNNGILIGGTNFGQAPNARLEIRGSGSTSATTALLVQNSSGNNALQVRDDRVIIMAGLPISSSGLPSGAIWNDSGTLKIV